MRIAFAVATVALAGCAPSHVLLPADPAASFEPMTFFAGRTRGEGVLDKTVGGSSRIVVDSSGRVDQNGNLILDQSIREDDKLPRLRRWVIRRSGPGRFTGTLTDAAGPVAITVAGPRATIRYQTKGGIAVRQQLALQPGGRTLLNRLSARRFGMPLARLDETIRKLD